MPTVSTRWIYPPNWAGALPPQGQGLRELSLSTIAVWADAVNEADAVKVNLSELVGPTGKPALRTVVKKIRYEIFDLSSVLIEWDRTPDVPIAIINNVDNVESWGEIDFTREGRQRGLVDPGGPGTGDIVVTTTGAASLSEYNLIIDFEVKEK